MLFDPPDVIGRRLNILRKALGFKTQEAFAESIGYDKHTYNPWEKGDGKRLLTFEAACKIRSKHKIPAEYLFWGEYADGMPARVLTQIQKLENEAKAAASPGPAAPRRLPRTSRNGPKRPAVGRAS